MFRWFERGVWVVLLFLAFTLGYWKGVKRTTSNLDFWTKIIKQKCEVETSARIMEHARAELDFANQLLTCRLRRLGLKSTKKYVTSIQKWEGMGGE